MSEFGERLRESREKKGLSRVDVMIELRRMHQSLWTSDEKLRRMETGEVAETKADPVLLAVLASLYGCKLRDLSEVAAAAAPGLRDLLEAGTRCSRVLAGAA